MNLDQLTALGRERPHTSGVVQLSANISGNLAEVKGQPARNRISSDECQCRRLRPRSPFGGARLRRSERDGPHCRHDRTLRPQLEFCRFNHSRERQDPIVTGLSHERGRKLEQPASAARARRCAPNGFARQGKSFGHGAIHRTLDNPQGGADLDLANAMLYGEPIDHVRARVDYLAQSIDVPRLQIVSGPARLDLSARYDHPAGNLERGNVQFQVNSSAIDLARIKNLQERSPGLGGMLQLMAHGAAEMQPNEPQVILRDLAGDLKATGITAQGKQFGDLSFTANTSAGKLNFALNSNLAGAAIQGQGSAQLIASYPVDAQLTFSNVAWTQWKA